MSLLRKVIHEGLMPQKMLVFNNPGQKAAVKLNY